jgi:hypothetical protein
VICDYKIAEHARCDRPATHVCLVECIGEEGSQSRTERRCDAHADNRVARDLIEAFTLAEWEALDNE